MRITTDEVRTTASMARLALSPTELERMTGEMDRILDYVAQLQDIDVSGVEPTSHAVPLSCPLRPDQIGQAGQAGQIGQAGQAGQIDQAGDLLPVEVALRGAPAPAAPYFAVPAILERDEG